MRLQKYMAKSGVASRRKSEEIILSGRVKVNGKLVKELGSKIDPDKDRVMVDDRPIELESNKVYIILNKPFGYTTTLKDRYSDKKVIDLIDGIDERIYPVGRLDEDTEGLLLLTNDGDLTYKLTHPSYEVKKKYIAHVKGIPNDKELDRFEKGIELDGSLTAPAKVNILKVRNKNAVLEIEIHEGRNRQVRRMCEYINHPVIDLERVSLDGLSLDGLKRGSWRYLSDGEVEMLKKAVE